MVCVPKAALIPDGALTWVGGLGLVWRPVQMCGRRRCRLTCVMAVPGATGNNKEHFGVNAEEARSVLCGVVSRGLRNSKGQRRWLRHELAGKR